MRILPIHEEITPLELLLITFLQAFGVRAGRGGSAASVSRNEGSGA